MGVPLPAVSARLGHSDCVITGRLAHSMPDDDNRADDAWKKALRGPVQ
jgi:hypothetical protein